MRILIDKNNKTVELLDHNIFENQRDNIISHYEDQGYLVKQLTLNENRFHITKDPYDSCNEFNLSEIQKEVVATKNKAYTLDTDIMKLDSMFFQHDQKLLSLIEENKELRAQINDLKSEIDEVHRILR